MPSTQVAEERAQPERCVDIKGLIIHVPIAVQHVYDPDRLPGAIDDQFGRKIGRRQKTIADTGDSLESRL